MEVSIKGSLVATNFMDMGSTSIKKGSRPIQAPGSTTKNQDGGFWSYRMDLSTRDSSNMTK